MSSRTQTFSIAILLFCIALLALATGLQGSLVGLLASQAEFGGVAIGYIATGYPAGILLGAWLVPRMIEEVGYIRVFAGLASLASSSALLLAIFIEPTWWFVLRVVTGIATTGLYIICEAWLNASTSNRTRGRVMALYLVVTYSMMGAGQFLLNVDDGSGYVRFLLASVILSFALVPITLLRIEVPVIVRTPPVSLAVVFRASPLATYAIFVNGLAQSALFGLGSAYGVIKGIPVWWISVMIALPTLGVTIVQYPLGMLADKVDRRLVLLAVSLFAALAAFLAASQQVSLPVTIAMFALFGTLAIPTRSVALAHINDQMESRQMLSASSRLFVIYGFGSSIGPLLVGTLMQSSGPDAFMYFQAAIFFSVLLVAALRMSLGPARRRSSQVKDAIASWHVAPTQAGDSGDKPPIAKENSSGSGEAT